MDILSFFTWNYDSVCQSDYYIAFKLYNFLSDILRITDQ